MAAYPSADVAKNAAQSDVKTAAKRSPAAARSATPNQNFLSGLNNLVTFGGPLNPIYDAEKADKAVDTGVRDLEKAGITRDIEAGAVLPFDPALSAQIINEGDKRNKAAKKPARAGTPRNAQTTSKGSTEDVDTSPAAATPESNMFATDLSNLNRSIAGLQATVSNNSAQVAALKAAQATDATAIRDVQTQIGSVQSASPTAAGAVNATTSNTGAGNTGGGISGFLSSTMGRIVIVAAIGGGIFYYVRSKGGIKKLGK